MSMKKNFLYPMMALCMMLFAASCSQEEVVTDSSRPEITTMNVNIPGNGDVNTRAMPTVPEGYKLRCLMQVVDAAGAAIQGDEYKQALTVPAEGSLTFSFTTPAAGYKVLFWADYIPQATSELTADHLYATTDLTQGVSYVESKLTDGSLFNNAAADAFFGKAEDGNSSVTLTRPFSRLNIKPAAEVAEEYSGYNQIAVEMKVPAGINILTGAALTTTQTIKYDGATQDKYWFNNFVFTGNATENLGEGNDIKIVFSKKEGEPTDTKTVTIAGEDVTTAENTHININVKPIDGSQSSVTVTFPEDLIDPNAPKPLAIGDYINKDGTFSKTYDAEQTVAIVWKLVTDGGAAVGDAASNYTAENNAKVSNNNGTFKQTNGTDLSGEEIIGYAFAIDMAQRSYIGKTEQDIYNGTISANIADLKSSSYAAIAKSKGIVTTLLNNSAIIKNYATHSINNTINSDKISNWYIPSYRQAIDFSTLLVGLKETGADPVIAKAFADAGGKFNGTRGNAASWHMTCDLTEDNKFACVNVQGKDSDEAPFVFTEEFEHTVKAGSQFAFRPVITIFKGITSK